MPFRYVINNIRTSNLVISRDRQRFRANVSANVSANVNARASANVNAGARAIRPIRSVNTRPHVSIQKTGAAVQSAFPCLFRAVTVPTGPVSYNNLKDLNIFTFLLWLEKLISDAKILASPMPPSR